MVYIYKKTIHGKNYYYLRVSKRVNGKLVVKDVAYLGNDISKIESKLNNLVEYKDEIRKGHRIIKKFIQSNYFLQKVKKLKLKNINYLDKGMLEQVEAIKLHYKNNFLKLDELTKKEVYKHFLIDFAFNTTSIEGNTITLDEANKLLNEDILPKNKTLREVYDLQNTENTFLWLLDDKPLFNEMLITDIHDRLLEKIDVRKGYRTQDIKVFKSKFEASPVKYLKIDMRVLMKWFKDNKKLHPLVLVGLLHHKLEKIHPFADGNGRTGRMLMNYILMKMGFPPLIISKKRRSDYLAALRNADNCDLNDNDSSYYKKLITYLAEEMVSSYWSNFNV